MKLTNVFRRWHPNGKKPQPPVLLASFKLFFSLLIFSFIASSALGQSSTVLVMGRVVDENGAGVQDVSVVAKGTNTGTTTGKNGNFSLKVPNGSTILVFTSIGYISKEAEISGQSNLQVSLQMDASSLGNVVVVGYGTQKKVTLTGAVSSISSKDLAARPVGLLSASLQGLAPGVTVVQNSGRPGGDAGTIRIRGIGTLNNNDPLVLIDGIEGAINSIDPNLVESISVLKDAASSSIYGSRAANGVVLITTKRAKGSQLSVSYNNYIGWQEITNLPKKVSALDHMNLINVAYKNTGRAPLYTDAYIQKYINEGPNNRDLYPDTDWQKLILTGSGLMHNHFVTVNGGGEKVKFLTSLGYFDQQGLYATAGFRRYTFRNNADIKFSDMFDARFDVQLFSATTTESGRGSSSVFNQMNRIASNV
ncbi:MAG TPA: SusC/RagA family TonB-linked outer membrane protein, partial [Chitinophagaceae bacterium]|nr:SusC/RagA family TonB-linked outer membrane protein [Chitinophagaceae bacterium]